MRRLSGIVMGSSAVVLAASALAALATRPAGACPPPLHADRVLASPPPPPPPPPPPAIRLECPAGTRRAEIPTVLGKTYEMITLSTCNGGSYVEEKPAWQHQVCDRRHPAGASVATAACLDADGHIDGTFVVATATTRWTGTCHDDVPDGEWRETTSGVTEVTTYRAGRKHGPFYVMTNDGAILHDGAWTDGREDGVWHWRDDLGRVARRQRYRAGVSVALQSRGFTCETDDAGIERCVVPERGRPRMIGIRPAGKKVATWTIRYPTGELLATFTSTGTIIGPPSGEHADGAFRVRYRSGALMATGTCVDGKRAGRFETWYPDCQRRQSVDFADDRYTRGTAWMRDGSVATTARPEHENQTMRSWLTDWSTGCSAFSDFALAVPDRLVED